MLHHPSSTGIGGQRNHFDCDRKVVTEGFERLHGVITEVASRRSNQGDRNRFHAQFR